MNFFTHPRAHYAMGAQLGLGWLERFSQLTLKAAESIAWHRHEQTEVIVCLRGTLNYEFRDHPSVTLPAGCFLVIPHGTEHRIIGGVDSPCRRLSLFLHAKRRPVGATDAFSSADCAHLHRLLVRNRLRPLIFPPPLGSSLARIANVLEADTPPSRARNLELRALAVFVLHSLATRPPATSWQPLKNRLMDSAVQWLKDHFAEKLTVEQLAAFMGYGRSRLNHLFREHTGLSPMEWLIRYRIERAKALLLDGISVHEAALRCGFPDPAFFSRTFSHLTGESPRAWLSGKSEALKRQTAQRTSRITPS